MKPALSSAITDRIQSFLIAVLFLGALCFYPHATAQATIAPLYQCTPTGSKCIPAKEGAWVYTISDPYAATPFASESAVYADITARMTGAGHAYCSISNPVDQVFATDFIGPVQTYMAVNTFWDSYGPLTGPNACSGPGVFHATWSAARTITCKTGWSLIYDSSTSPYCACPWGTQTACPMKPCYKGCVPKGQPINVLTGTMTETQLDYSVAGSPLRLERLYNSAVAVDHGTASTSISAPMGLGWSTIYFQHVEYTDFAGHSGVTVYRANGSELAFNETSPNVFDFGGEDSGHVVRTLDGFGNPTGWKYFTGSDDIEVYDVYGVLQSITSRSGIALTLHYSAGLLSSVSDSFGNQLTFTWTPDLLHIQSVTLPGGTQVSYTYTGQSLTGVTYPDTTSRTYLYELGGNLASVMTGLQDELGVRLMTWTYDGTGRATASYLSSTSVENYSISTPAWNQRTVTDPLGQARTYTFAIIQGEPRYTVSTSTCSGCGDAAGVTYDAFGNIASRTDFNGNVTTYLYDTARTLETSRTEAYGTAKARTIGTTWNPNYRLPATVTEPYRTSSFTYDTAGNVLTRTVTDTSVVPNVARTTTFTYDAFGHILTRDGPRTDVSDVTTYTYYTCSTGYQCGQLNTVTNALGQITTFNTYNAHGQPLTITDPNGVVTTLTYDARQRVTSQQVGTETTTYTYWGHGLLNKVTVPDGSYLRATYDSSHRLYKVTDSVGNYTLWTLDSMGNRKVESAYDPGGVMARTHSRVFNTLNQLLKEVGAAGTAAVTTQFGYDTNGNRTTISAPLSRNTVDAYDELNRLKQVTDPALGNTYYTYDAADRLSTVQDPKGLLTSYGYTGFGELLSVTSADTGTTTNTYDSAGNLKTSADARGAITTYIYDALNRRTSAAYKVGAVTDQTISFTYDAGTNGKGHLTGASDANHSMSWGYDAQGRTTAKSQTIGTVTKSVAYGYTNGDLTTITLPSGQVLTYTYDTNHHVASVKVGTTTILSGATYKPFGQVTGWTWGNGTTTSRDYDLDAKMTQFNSAGLKTIAYDDAFRITGITDTVTAANSYTYGYDALDRITSAAKTGTTYGWTYDANGNRLTQTGTSASTFTISPTSNRLTSVSGALARTYGYDAAGNVLGYTTAAATFNNRGRMKTLNNGTVTATYTYNALGQIIKQNAPGIILFMYDEQGHVQGEYSTTGALVQETVWVGDTPVATLRPSGSNVVLYYVHTDQLNTPFRVTRASDNKLMWTWYASPFGTDAPNENPASGGVFHYDLRFAGQLYDAEAGQYHNGMREYDPNSGRYLQSDPIGLSGGTNTYAYVGSNPTGKVDPTGLYTVHMGAPIIDMVDVVPQPIWEQLTDGPRLGSTLPPLLGTTCNCKKVCDKWMLDQCKSLVLVQIKIREGMSAERQGWAIAREMEHYGDITAAEVAMVTAGNQMEGTLRAKTWDFERDCRKDSVLAVQGAVVPILVAAYKQSATRDAPGGTHSHGWQ